MALANLTTAQKAMGAAAIGGVGLLFLMKKGGGGGGGTEGIAVVDVRRPTDDMNTPGAEWGAGSTMVEITRAYTDLMGRLIPPTGNKITSPATPAKPGVPIPVAPKRPPVIKTPTIVAKSPVPVRKGPPVKQPVKPAPPRGGHFPGGTKREPFFLRRGQPGNDGTLLTRNPNFRFGR